MTRPPLGKGTDARRSNKVSRRRARTRPSAQAKHADIAYALSLGLDCSIQFPFGFTSGLSERLIAFVQVSRLSKSIQPHAGVVTDPRWLIVPTHPAAAIFKGL